MFKFQPDLTDVRKLVSCDPVQQLVVDPRTRNARASLGPYLIPFQIVEMNPETKAEGRLNRVAVARCSKSIRRPPHNMEAFFA